MKSAYATQLNFIHAFQIRCSLVCVWEIQRTLIGIKAAVRFSALNKRKVSHISSKGAPISIAVLHSRVKSDENNDDSAMNLNNSMNIWILNDPRNVGTHLNRREVVMSIPRYSKKPLNSLDANGCPLSLRTVSGRPCVEKMASIPFIMCCASVFFRTMASIQREK